MKSDQEYIDLIDETITKLILMMDYSDEVIEFIKELENLRKEVNGQNLYDISTAPQKTNITFEPTRSRLQDLDKKTQWYFESHYKEIQAGFWYKQGEKIDKDLPNDTTEVSWERFFEIYNKFKYSSSSKYTDLIAKSYAQTAIKILIEQLETEQKIDLSIPVANLDADFLYKYVVQEIIIKLMDFIGANKDKKEKIYELINSLRNKKDILENIANPEIWKILTGKQEVKIITLEDKGREEKTTKVPAEPQIEPEEEKTTKVPAEPRIEPPKRENTRKSANDAQTTIIVVPEKYDSQKTSPTTPSSKKVIEKIMNSFSGVMSTKCILGFEDGNTKEYKTWRFLEEADYNDFEKAKTIIFKDNIPIHVLIRFNQITFRNLKKLEFSDGVRTIPSVFDGEKCPLLEELSIAMSVKEIKRGALKGLKHLQSISMGVIPEGLTIPMFEGSTVRKIELAFDDNIQNLVLKNCMYLEEVITGYFMKQTIPFYSFNVESDQYIYLSEEQLRKEMCTQFINKYEEHKDGVTTEKVFCRYYDEENGIYKGIRVQWLYETQEKADQEVKRLKEQGIRAVAGPFMPKKPSIEYYHAGRNTVYIIDESIENCWRDYLDRGLSKKILPLATSVNVSSKNGSRGYRFTDDDLVNIYVPEPKKDNPKKQKFSIYDLLQNIYSKTICTLRFASGFISELHTWESIKQINFSNAIEIVLYEDIPETTLAEIKSLRHIAVRTVKFADGVNIVPSIFNRELCPRLQEIYVSKSVREIEENAFEGLDNLERVVFEGIPEKIHLPILSGSWVKEIEIGESETERNDSLSKIELINCKHLESVIIDGESVPFFSIKAGSDDIIYLDADSLYSALTISGKHRYQQHEDGKSISRSIKPFYDGILLEEPVECVYLPKSDRLVLTKDIENPFGYNYGEQ